MKFSSVIKLGVVVLAIAAVVVFAMTKLAGPVDDAEASAVGRVRRGNLVQRVTISGVIMPKKRLDVRPQFKGYVQKLYVKVGDRVKTGDPLVTFSPSLAAGESNYPVRAAFNGVVTQVLRQEGEAAADVGDNLTVRVEDVTQLYVIAAVPELDIAKVKLGQEAMVRVSALSGESFSGEITEISLSARERERYSSSSTDFTIRVALKDSKKLLPGLSALMDVITSKRENVLILSHEYLQQDSEGAYAILTSGERRPLELGLQTDEAVEILKGLNEGDAVRPIDFLRLPSAQEE